MGQKGRRRYGMCNCHRIQPLPPQHPPSSSPNSPRYNRCPPMAPVEPPGVAASRTGLLPFEPPADPLQKWPSCPGRISHRACCSPSVHNVFKEGTDLKKILAREHPAARLPHPRLSITVRGLDESVHQVWLFALLVLFGRVCCCCYLFVLSLFPSGKPQLSC